VAGDCAVFLCLYFAKYIGISRRVETLDDCRRGIIQMFRIYFNIGEQFLMNSSSVKFQWFSFFFSCFPENV